jgi:hypothetical protein
MEVLRAAINKAGITTAALVVARHIAAQCAAFINLEYAEGSEAESKSKHPRLNATAAVIKVKVEPENVFKDPNDTPGLSEDEDDLITGA